MVDLMNPDHAYLFGFLQADANFYEGSRNRGKIQLEIAEYDEEILHKLQKLIPIHSSITNRTRDTNFKNGYSSSTLVICDYQYRQELKSLGMPVGKKSGLIQPPKMAFDRAGYWRGILDADGSVGVTNDNRPFVSLTTDSTPLCKGFLDLIFDITGKTRNVARNSRDAQFNPMITQEAAQELIRFLGWDRADLTLTRKKNLAQQAMKWKRPKGMRGPYSTKRWTPEEDEVILSCKVSEAVLKLGRSPKSIGTRKWRLQNGNIDDS